MRMERARNEPLDPVAMRELLEREAPAPEGDMPPGLVEPERYAEWMRSHREARAKAVQLCAAHGWTLLELLQAEFDARYAETPGT